jgi:dienelactone hydrolase
MKRRIQASGAVDRRKRILSICLRLSLVVGLADTSVVLAQATLPGTAPLIAEGDLAEQMVEGIKRYLLRETDVSIEKRARLWKRNYGSLESYDQSVASNRERFAKIIGAVDARVAKVELHLDATPSTPALISAGTGYKVYAVQWSVFEGVTGEGLLLEPNTPPVARIVAIPDADQSPEMLAGLAPGVQPTGQFARRFAENGCQVLVPVLINRQDTWSGITNILPGPSISAAPGSGTMTTSRMTNQPHREWIYRMAYEVGRHIIGYEVQKVLAGVDWFTRENRDKQMAPIGVFGYGEGGLLALYSAALDSRIQATGVSGYFQSRQQLWQEPIYRDVWGLLKEFGDAELASLIAPRALIVEASRGPEITGPPVETEARKGATPNGKLISPPLSSVEAEVERARSFFAGLKAKERLQLVVSDGGNGLAGSEATLTGFLGSLGVKTKIRPAASPPQDLRSNYDGTERLHRQFDQLINYTQWLLGEAPKKRAAFWSKADASSAERWKQTTQFHRDYIWDEVIGRLPSPSQAANARTRQIYDEPKFKGYEVMLDVWPDVFAYGILLVPKDLNPGERRPVVVCQHGLEGRPRDTIENNEAYHYYKQFAARLAEQGFVTFSPQNPYIGRDRFRLIQRQGHPSKLALFSFILGQHERLLDWLASQSFVDPDRIGFYGLSYGGKTAVRVPPLLDRYALSICSADFNEWVWKNTRIDSRYSYLVTLEYDMIEFDFANVVNYSELANLMAPRPFMVERGHHDGVAPDEWVAYEYAKTRYFYATKLKIPENTEIEFFDGPHTINGQGTFAFLRKHLKWPK